MFFKSGDILKVYLSAEAEFLGYIANIVLLYVEK